MSLTKKDKEEIVEIVKSTVTMLDLVSPNMSNEAREAMQEVAEKATDAQEMQMQISRWEAEAIDTGLGFVIAPENYYEGDKQHFTWDEATAIQDAIKASGWRLPTVAEWVQMYGRFGIDEDGDDDIENLENALKLTRSSFSNYGLFNDGGSDGCYWSSTAYSGSNAYFLGYSSIDIDSQGDANKSNYGFSVRMIKEVKNER